MTKCIHCQTFENVWSRFTALLLCTQNNFSRHEWNIQFSYPDSNLNERWFKTEILLCHTHHAYTKYYKNLWLFTTRAQSWKKQIQLMLNWISIFKYTLLFVPINLSLQFTFCIHIHPHPCVWGHSPYCMMGQAPTTLPHDPTEDKGRSFILFSSENVLSLSSS